MDYDIDPASVFVFSPDEEEADEEKADEKEAGKGREEGLGDLKVEVGRQGMVTQPDSRVAK